MPSVRAGLIAVPPVIMKEDKEDIENMIEAAMREARRHEHSQDTVWTDGSRLSGGGVGGGVA